MLKSLCIILFYLFIILTLSTLCFYITLESQFLFNVWKHTILKIHSRDAKFFLNIVIIKTFIIVPAVTLVVSATGPIILSGVHLITLDMLYIFEALWPSYLCMNSASGAAGRAFRYAQSSINEGGKKVYSFGLRNKKEVTGVSIGLSVSVVGGIILHNIIPDNVALPKILAVIEELKVLAIENKEQVAQDATNTKELLELKKLDSIQLKKQTSLMEKGNELLKEESLLMEKYIKKQDEKSTWSEWMFGKQGSFVPKE